MSHKLIFVSLSTAVILIAAIFLQIKAHFWDTPLDNNPQPAINTSTIPTTTIPARLSDSDKVLVKDYLKANLSSLSPIPESLGGQFYLTELIFTGPDSADIAYEDGHNSYQAAISFSIGTDQVNLINFTIISQNNQKYPDSISSTSPSENTSL